MSAPQVQFEVVRVETFEGDEGVVTFKPVMCMGQNCEDKTIATYVGRKRDYQVGQRFTLVPATEKKPA